MARMVAASKILVRQLAPIGPETKGHGIAKTQGQMDSFTNGLRTNREREERGLK